VDAAQHQFTRCPKQIGKDKCFHQRYADAIEDTIRSLVDGLDDETVMAMWCETETGMADSANVEELVPDSVRMDLGNRPARFTTTK